MDTQRLILLFIFGFSLLMLWEAWERAQQPKPPAIATAPLAPQARTPEAPTGPAPTPGAPAAVPGAAKAAKGEVVSISTDLFQADIDTIGATLRRLELFRHKDATDPKKNLVLLGA